MELQKKPKSAKRQAADPHRKCRRRQFFAAFIAFMMFLTALLLIPGVVKTRVVEHITWKDLLDDFTGQVSGSWFQNGTFLSYDPPVRSNPPETKLPSQILVKDRIVAIGTGWTFPMCTYPPDAPGPCGGASTEIDFESTGPGKTDISFPGEKERSDMRDLVAGDEVVVRLNVFSYWHFQDGVWKWASEGLRELHYGSTPSALSKADPATRYVHVPPTHPTGLPRAPVQHPLGVRPIAHDTRAPGVTVLRHDHLEWGPVLDFGTLTVGTNASFPAALGMVAEIDSPRITWNVSAKGSPKDFVSMSMHSRTWLPASADSGVEILTGGVSVGEFEWTAIGTDGDVTTAHLKSTPVHAATGVRWLPGDDDSTMSDTIWLEVNVSVPLGTQPGTYDGEIEFRFGLGARGTQFLMLKVRVLFEVE